MGGIDLVYIQILIRKCNRISLPKELTRDFLLNNIGKTAQKHSDCASHLWNIRETYLSLLTDIKAETIPMEEIMKKRDLLQNELFNIYQGTPKSISKAYDEATKALKTNEELTFSDEEIDMFLPKELRKSTNAQSSRLPRQIK